MHIGRFFKSSDVLVLRDGPSNGLKLLHYQTKEVLMLNPQQSIFWTLWNDDVNDGKIPVEIRDDLISHKFILQHMIKEDVHYREVDHLRPTIIERYIKWYDESPDLSVLFNTTLMRKNNPLLVLGPYGALCWRGICKGNTIGQIRQEVLRVFGADEVIYFLKRLMSLGFIKPLHALNRIEPSKENVTKEFHTPDVQFELSHGRIPWYCLWEMCTICNLQCNTCYLPNFNARGPDSGLASKIVEQIIDSGFFFVSLMGGEVLLIDDLEKIINQLRKSGLFVKMISNGQLLSLRRAESLAASGLNQIEMSFDGLTEEMHDASRGKGSFIRALDAIKNAQESGIPRVGMVWTIHSHNITQLKLLPKFMDKYKITECYLSLFRKIGQKAKVSIYRPIDSASEKTIYDHLKKWKDAYPHVTIVLNSKCSCGRTSIVIGENGNVRVCPFSYQNIGNIHEKHLIHIWRSHVSSIKESGALGYCMGQSI